MKKIIALLLGVLLLFSLAACSAAPAKNSETSSDAAAPQASAGAAYDEGSYDGGAEEAAEAETGGLGGLPNTDLPQTNHKLTQTVNFEINTKQYDADYAKINELLAAAGGYVANEETSAYSSDSGKNYGRNSRLSLRVPADNLTSFIDGVSGVGEVVGKHKSTEDLTSQYYDTEARIEMLELRKERLMGYLANATDAEDIVAFESELSDVLYELDQLQGNKRHMDQLVDYATVDITLTELITPETIGSDGLPLGDRAADAFAMSASGFGEFWENFALFWVQAALPLLTIAIFAAAAWGIVKLVLFLRKKYYAAHPDKVKPARPQYYPPYPPQQAPPANMQRPQAPVQPAPPQPQQAQPTQPVTQQPQQQPQPQQQDQKGEKKDQ